MDPTYDLVQNIINTEYQDLPAQIVEISKKEVLDTLGVAIAGAGRAGIPELLKLLSSFGGKKQSSVITAGKRMPVIFAIQINASMMHALDYDDAMDNTAAHTGAISVPVCFALSEYLGKISGKQCITALALGADLQARLGLATRYKIGMVKSGWFYASLYGYLTSAAVAGKMIGLDADKLINAFGLAYQKTSGNQQAVIDGALAKRMAVGFAASGGVLAALMAENGITGAKNCLEGEYGLYNMYHRGGYDREALLSGLGKDFKGKDICFKRYPSCRVTHPFIDAALILVKENDIKPEQVSEITVCCGNAGYSLCVPLDVKCHPRNPVDTQFSIPWGIATAVVKRKFSIADISEDALKDVSVIKIAEKIRVQKDASLMGHALEPGRVEIKTRNGAFIKQVDFPSGGPQNPISYNECANKFRDCAAYSIKPLSKEVVETIIEMVSRLEEVEDVSEIIKLLN